MTDEEKYEQSLILPSHNRSPLIELAFEHAKIEGLVVEFGVFSGDSIEIIERTFKTTVHGFDSWLGLPESDQYFKKGEFSRNGQPINLNNKNIILYDGWFADTLPKWKDQYKDVIKFANIDCDVYSSTNDILTILQDKFVSGTVIHFDELRGYVGWEEREHKAFQQFIARTGLDYRYLARSADYVQCLLQLI